MSKNKGILTCEFCSATAPDDSKHRGRFRRRHHAQGRVCVRYEAQRLEKVVFSQQLAQGTKSVEDIKEDSYG